MVTIHYFLNVRIFLYTLNMNKNFKIIVIGGSAGSFQVISQILSKLNPEFKIPIFLCLHRLKNVTTGFEEALNINTTHKVHEVRDKEIIKKGKIYLAPANYHMLAEIGNSVTLSIDSLFHYSRPSIDLTFDSFSYIYKEKMLSIILSGANSDGAGGMHKAHQRGSYTIVQNPNDALVKTMVDSTLKLFQPNKILSTDEIINFLNNL